VGRSFRNANPGVAILGRPRQPRIHDAVKPRWNRRSFASLGLSEPSAELINDRNSSAASPEGREYCVAASRRTQVSRSPRARVRIEGSRSSTRHRSVARRLQAPCSWSSLNAATRTCRGRSLPVSLVSSSASSLRASFSTAFTTWRVTAADESVRRPPTRSMVAALSLRRERTASVRPRPVGCSNHATRSGMSEEPPVSPIPAMTAGGGISVPRQVAIVRCRFITSPPNCHLRLKAHHRTAVN